MATVTYPHYDEIYDKYVKGLITKQEYYRRRASKLLAESIFIQDQVNSSSGLNVTQDIGKIAKYGIDKPRGFTK